MRHLQAYQVRTRPVPPCSTPQPCGRRRLGGSSGRSRRPRARATPSHPHRVQLLGTDRCAALSDDTTRYDEDNSRDNPGVNIPCKLCQKRRAKRHCPGVQGEICLACCGTEREVTVDCPLDCDYLRDARVHDRPVALSEDDLPNRDIRVSEEFIRKQEHVVMWLANALARVMEARRSVDGDAREGLESLIKTYRTLEACLLYTSD